MPIFYRIWNGHREYDKALAQRGSITFWLSDDFEQTWLYTGEKQRGSQFDYSEKAIEVMLTLKEVFHLTNRSTEGFIRSVFAMLGAPLPVPDHSTLSRRGKTLKVSLPKKSQGSFYLVLDSSGLKIYGEGEWKVRKHGYSKRRTWRKLHIGGDPESGEIVAVVLTENSVSDDAVVKELLEQIEETLLACAGDGAYDKRKVYNALRDHSPDADVRIPPRKTCTEPVEVTPIFGSMAIQKKSVINVTRIYVTFASMDERRGRMTRAITFGLWRKPSCSV